MTIAFSALLLLTTWTTAKDIAEQDDIGGGAAREDAGDGGDDKGKSDVPARDDVEDDIGGGAAREDAGDRGDDRGNSDVPARDDVEDDIGDGAAGEDAGDNGDDTGNRDAPVRDDVEDLANEYAAEAGGNSDTGEAEGGADGGSHGAEDARDAPSKQGSGHSHERGGRGSKASAERARDAVVIPVGDAHLEDAGAAEHQGKSTAPRRNGPPADGQRPAAAGQRGSEVAGAASELSKRSALCLELLAKQRKPVKGDENPKHKQQVDKEEQKQASTSCVGSTSAGQSPLRLYFSMAEDWAAEPTRQAPLALAMAVASVAFLWNGPLAWRVAFVGAVGVAAAAATRLEANSLGATPTLAAEIVIAVQVGLAAAVATHVGFEGSQVLFGSLFGLCYALVLGSWAREVDNDVLTGFWAVWCALGACIGFLLFTIARPLFLAALSSILGGMLGVASAGLLLGRAYAQLAGGVGDGGDASIQWLPPAAAAGIDGSASVAGATASMLASHGLWLVHLQLGCAVLASVLYSISRMRALALAPLLGAAAVPMISIVAAAVLRPESQGPGGDSVPPPWVWPCCGGALWLAATAMSAWRQFGGLQHCEANNFWRGLLPCASEPEGSAPSREEEDPSRTRLLGPGAAGAASAGYVAGDPSDDEDDADRQQLSSSPSNRRELQGLIGSLVVSAAPGLAFLSCCGKKARPVPDSGRRRVLAMESATTEPEEPLMPIIAERATERRLTREGGRSGRTGGEKVDP